MDTVIVTSKLLLTNLPDTLKKDVSGITDAHELEQLNLFGDNKSVESKAGNAVSNSFNAYDLSSRFLRNRKQKVKVSDSPKKIIHERRISERLDGVTYEGILRISPAILKGKDEDYFAWPSDREEKVERSLIRLASQGKIARISGRMGERYGIYFTLAELNNELKSVNQSLNLQELKESLHILKGAEMSLQYDTSSDSGVTQRNESTMNYLSSIHFSTVKGRSNMRCVAVLNELMSTQIESVEYKSYYFNRTQSFKRSLSIWLSFRLYRMFRYASPAHTHHFKLVKTMVKYGSIDNEEEATKKIVSLRRDMTTTMKDLVAADIIKSYDIESIKDGSNSIIDYIYTLYPTDKFCSEILELNKHHKMISSKAQKL